MSGPVARFTSPDAPFVDQMTSDPQSWNLYSYARNNPMKLVDRTGRNACGHNQDKNCRVTIRLEDRNVDDNGDYDDKFSAREATVLRQGEYKAIATVTIESLLNVDELSNIATSTESFLAKTTPSNSKDYPTAANGDYDATRTLHHGSYPAIALNNNGSAPITTDVNPATKAAGIASAIQVHKAGIDNFTGVGRDGRAVSGGCQTTCTSRYNSFKSFTGITTSDGTRPQSSFRVIINATPNISRRTK